MSRKLFSAGFSSIAQLLSSAIIYFCAARLHSISDVELGIIGISFSVGLLFYTLSEMGVGSYIIRSCINDSDFLKDNFSDLINFQVVTSLLTAFLFVLYTIWIYEDYHHRMIALLSGANFFSMMISRSFYNYFIALEKFSEEAKNTILETVWVLTSVVIVLFLQVSIYEFLVILLSVRLITILINFQSVLFFTESKFFLRPDLAKIKFFVKSIWPLGISNLLAIYLITVDSLIIGIFLTSLGQEGIDQFQSALRIVLLFSVLPTFLSKVFYPRLLYIKSQDNIKFKNIFGDLTTYTLLLGVSLGYLVMANAELIYELLIGRANSEAVVNFKIMIIALLFRLSFTVNLYFLINSLDKLRLKITLFSCVFASLLGYWLVQTHGISGIILSFVLVNTINTLIFYFFAYLRSSIRQLLISPIILLLAAAIFFLNQDIYTSQFYIYNTIFCATFLFFATFKIFKIYIQA